MTTVARALEDARARGVEISDDDARVALTGAPEAPLATRALIGFGIWIGAALMVSLIDFVDDLLDDKPVALGLGALLLGLAALFSRLKRWGDVRLHLTVLSVVFAEVVLATTFPSRDLGFAICLFALQLTVVAVVANPLTRFTATSMAVFLGGIITDQMIPRRFGGLDGLQDLYYFGLVGLCAALWLVRDHPRAVRWAKLHTPLAWATALGVLPHVLLHAVEPSRFGFRWAGGASLALGALAFFVVVRLAREVPGRARASALIVAGLALAALAGLVHNTPWVLAGLILLGLAHGRREKGLYALALAALVVALYGHYFHQSTSLLSKAAFTGAAGVALLAAAAAVRALFGRASAPRVAPLVDEAAGNGGSVAVRAGAFAAPPRFRWERLAIAGAVCLALGVPLGLAAQKAHVVRTGEVVLLELAPVDPRSLMQGDYMRLAYRLPALDANDGFVRVHLDPSGVARHVVPDDGSALGLGELRLRYRRRSRGVRIGAESFFFEEGQGARYANARYGELRVAGNGEVVLVGLRDAALNAL